MSHKHESPTLEHMILDSLAEGEKFAWDVVRWIRSRHGQPAIDRLRDFEIPDTLGAMAAADLIEALLKEHATTSSSHELGWCYRRHDHHGDPAPTRFASTPRITTTV